MQVMPSGDESNRRSECPIACSLDVLGDRWTLLVVRDLLDGKRRFRDFETSAEGIPTNILTDRLKRLVAAGLAERQQPEGSRRYEYVPTKRATDLRPVLIAVAKWGNTHIPNTWVPPVDYLR